MFHFMPSTSQHWRQHAEHARVMAVQLRGPRAKVAMMNLAVSYEMLAVRAQMRELAGKIASIRAIEGRVGRACLRRLYGNSLRNR